MKVRRCTETNDAPGWQGAEDEQRSQPGCSFRRMQADFHHGLLGARGGAPGQDVITIVPKPLGRGVGVPTIVMEPVTASTVNVESEFDVASLR